MYKEVYGLGEKADPERLTKITLDYLNLGKVAISIDGIVFLLIEGGVFECWRSHDMYKKYPQFLESTGGSFPNIFQSDTIFTTRESKYPEQSTRAIKLLMGLRQISSI